MIRPALCCNYQASPIPPDLDWLFFSASEHVPHIIYVNGFHERQAAAARGGEERGDENRTRYWRTHAIIGCDGGMDSFGVIYDPATGRFSQIEFNNTL